MIPINTEDKLEGLIINNEMTVIYFNGSKCGACEIIIRKIEGILTKYPKIKSYEIDGERNVEIAAKYQVFSLPVILLYIEGKETLRIGRNVDFLDLEKQINRYYQIIFN